MGEPGFWDDQARAAKTSAEHARTTKKVDAFAALQSDVEDLDGLVELAEEDPSMATEVEEQLQSVERASPIWRRNGCSPVPTTRVTRWSRSMPAPAAPTPRTGPRWSCA